MKTDFFRKALPFALAAMTLIVMGCPHNDYTVTLEPAGPAMVRTLTFYRADGMNTNTGSPDYRTFDPQELSAIAHFYPTNCLTNNGNMDVHRVKGSFGNQMPDDVGGAGVYTNFSTSLGSAGFYVERFRGNEDLAGLTDRRLKAADQLTDLLIGWSQSELAKDPHYPQLKTFLDGDFRHDIKNVSQYFWEWQVVGDRETNAAGEFMARISQYLYERGYFKLEEIPGILVMINRNDELGMCRWLQRLVARRMGVPDSDPIPASLGFLASGAAMDKSFTNYFVRTDLYRQKLAELKANAAPDAAPPDPDTVAGSVLNPIAAVDFNLFDDEPDHVTVKLALTAEPIYSNGKWDETNGMVVWSSDIQSRTNLNHLPFMCFATWVVTDEAFQTNHFGNVIISGEDLMQYCMWRCGQNAQHGAEWDAFLADLKPGGNSAAKVDAFRFAGETDADTTNSSAMSSALPRSLLAKGLK